VSPDLLELKESRLICGGLREAIMDEEVDGWVVFCLMRRLARGPDARGILNICTIMADVGMDWWMDGLMPLLMMLVTE